MKFIKVKFVALICLFALFASTTSMAQNHDGTVKVTITEEVDGTVNTSVLTFPDKATADRKLKEMGYGEADFKANSAAVANSRKVSVAMESSGLTDIETGEIRLNKLMNVPDDATIEELPNGGKKVTWIEVDANGNIYTKTATFNKGGSQSK